MIAVKIYGGLAGQMLQYSIGRTLSEKCNTSLYLDISWYKNRNFQEEQYPREFKLHNLNTAYKILDVSGPLNKFIYTKYCRGLNPFYLRPVLEKDFSKFDASVMEAGNNLFLDGYFFSHKYFIANRQLLSQELSPKIKMNADNAYYLDKIRNSNSVSVHFRRGDYTLTDFHGLLQNSYYQQAVDIIKQKANNPNLFVFSDEPLWVKENITFDVPFEIVDINKDEYNFLDIELMKNCKHNIIANSGFSWWGALLNYHSNSIVIAPRKWTNSQHAEFENMPDNWITI
jgi:hypothetical protein